jgi:hypothetical protein
MDERGPKSVSNLLQGSSKFDSIEEEMLTRSAHPPVPTLPGNLEISNFPEGELAIYLRGLLGSSMCLQLEFIALVAVFSRARVVVPLRD